MRFLVFLIFAAPCLWPQSTDRAWRSFEKGRAEYLTFTVKGYERAIRHFNDALVHDPAFFRAHAGLAEAYVLLASEHEKAGVPAAAEYEKAAAHAREALMRDTINVNSFRAAAHVAYLRDGKNNGQQIFELLQEALRRDSTDAESWYLLWLLTDNANTEGVIRKAQRLNPDLYVVQYALGLAHARKKEWESATAYYLKCIDLVKENYLAYFALGNAYSQQKQYLSSIDPYENAIRYGVPGNDIHLYIGLSYYYTDDNKKARRHLQTYIDKNPSTPLKGQIYDILKELD